MCACDVVWAACARVTLTQFLFWHLLTCLYWAVEYEWGATAGQREGREGLVGRGCRRALCKGSGEGVEEIRVYVPIKHLEL